MDFKHEFYENHFVRPHRRVRLLRFVDSHGESVLISRHPLARSHPHAILCQSPAALGIACTSAPGALRPAISLDSAHNIASYTRLYSTVSEAGLCVHVPHLPRAPPCGLVPGALFDGGHRTSTALLYICHAPAALAPRPLGLSRAGLCMLFHGGDHHATQHGTCIYICLMLSPHTDATLPVVRPAPRPAHSPDYHSSRVLPRLRSRAGSIVYGRTRPVTPMQRAIFTPHHTHA